MFSKASPLTLAICALVSALTGASIPAAILLGSSTTTLAQQPPAGQGQNTVSIQPSNANRPGRSLVVVTVDKSRVHVGETVTFTLSPASLVTNPKLNVTIDFGDRNRKETRQTTVTHTYGATGHYKVYASVVSPGFEIGSPDDPTPPPIPSVTLIASPTSVVAGSSVNFNAQISANYPKITYRFVFGDGSQTDWQETPYTNHTYGAGGTYSAYVDLGVGERGRIKQVGGSVRQSIFVANSTRPPDVTDPKPPIIDLPTQPKKEPRPGPVQLSVNPTPVETGKSVTFNARAESTNPSIRYRFDYGDGSSTRWQESSQTTHAYAAPGKYTASVNMGLETRGTIRGLSIARQGIQVTKSDSPVVATASPTPGRSGSPTPRPSSTSSPGVIPVGPISEGGSDVTPPVPGGELPENWWVYLLMALLLIFVGYQVYRSLFVPRATFHANRDTGSSEMSTGPEGLAINSQVLLRPNLSDGQYLVQSDEPSLIRSVRRENV